MSQADPRHATAPSYAASHRSLGGEIIFLWVAILLALSFWAPLTFGVDSGILSAG